MFQIGFILALFLIPNFAYADVVWPALLFADRLAIIAIPVGLVIEYTILKRILSGSNLKVFLVTFLMNIVSAVVGGILLVILGLLWEMGPGIILYKVLELGTFNPITWSATILFAVIITSYIEYKFLQIAFRYPKQDGILKAIVIGNIASVTLALVSLWIFPKNL